MGSSSGSNFLIYLEHGLQNNKYTLWTKIYGTVEQELTLDFTDYENWHKEMLIYNLKTYQSDPRD